MKLSTVFGLASALFGVFVQCSELHRHPRIYVTPYVSDNCTAVDKPSSEGEYYEHCLKFKHGFRSLQARIKGYEKLQGKDCWLDVYSEKKCSGHIQHRALNLSSYDSLGVCARVDIREPGSNNQQGGKSARMVCEDKKKAKKQPATQSTTTTVVIVPTSANPEPSEPASPPEPSRSTTCSKSSTVGTLTTTETYVTTKTKPRVIEDVFTQVIDVCSFYGGQPLTTQL